MTKDEKGLWDNTVAAIDAIAGNLKTTVEHIQGLGDFTRKHATNTQEEIARIVGILEKLTDEIDSLKSVEKKMVTQDSLQQEFKNHRKAIVGDMIAAIRSQISQRRKRKEAGG